MEKRVKEKPNYGFWNWGTGITIAIIVAASLMIFLVYKSMNVTFDMVEKDYYAEELKFDGKMKATENTHLLSSPLSINETDELIIVSLPKECIGKTDNGTLTFYRPSAKDLDLFIPFTANDDGNIIVEKTKMQKGLYRMKASWNMDGKDYLVEKNFYVTIQ